MSDAPLLDDRELGLYEKYEVTRLHDPEGKHDSCWYFVLDPQHDPIAALALSRYASLAGEAGYGPLSRDLHHKAGDAIARDPETLARATQMSLDDSSALRRVKELAMAAFTALDDDPAVRDRASVAAALEFLEKML